MNRTDAQALLKGPHANEPLTYHPEIKEQIQQTFHKLIDSYLQELTVKEAARALVSEMNFNERHKIPCFTLRERQQMPINAGDILYVDFGRQYLQEAGYCHPCIVLGRFKEKLLVVPLSSNTQQFHDACLFSKEHLIPIFKDSGHVSGLHKDSVAIINDLKFINETHTIQKLGHLEINSPTFHFLFGNILKMIIPKVKEKTV